MRWKKGCSCINLGNGSDAWIGKIRAHASLFGCDSGRRPIRVRKTWCAPTIEQGLAGSEAPRPVRRRRLGAGRRGARRRRNKVLRGVKHHVRYAGGALSSEDVVLDDERTRFCGERGTTSVRPEAYLSRIRPEAQLRAGGPPKKDRRTVGPPNSSNFPNSPTSPSGFSWSSSWIAASSGFWHVPARSGRSAADPWNRTGSNNSCC